jgi:peptidoglycan/xylan/chitin deacetylase (PgdA/CDA1 family)
MTKFACRVISIVAALLAACAPPDPEAGVDEIAREVITGGQINGNGLPAKTVVFTYDDGPDEHTLELARYLNEQGIRATFFVNGRRFCKTLGPDGSCLVPPDVRPCAGYEQAAVASPKYYPESMLDELLALGHRIGNHTQSHCYLTEQSSVERVGFEVKATQDILDRHICDGVYLFRAPYGAWNGGTASRINANMGVDKLIGPINWDVDGTDWDCWQKGTSPEACANRYFNLVNGRDRQNGIFLMHDRPEFRVGYEGPVLMTRILVPRLRAAGYRFGTLDEVLKLPATADGGTCPPPLPPPASSSDGAPTPTPDGASSPADAGAPDTAPPPITPMPPPGGPGEPPTGGGPAPAGGPGGAPPVSTAPTTPAAPASGGCRYVPAPPASSLGLASLWIAALLFITRRRRPRHARALS